MQSNTQTIIIILSFILFSSFLYYAGQRSASQTIVVSPSTAVLESSANNSAVNQISETNTAPEEVDTSVGIDTRVIEGYMLELCGRKIEVFDAYDNFYRTFEENNISEEQAGNIFNDIFYYSKDLRTALEEEGYAEIYDDFVGGLCRGASQESL